MPVGMPEVLPRVLDYMHAHNPAAILELGIGYGFWGAAIRNYCGTNPSTGCLDPACGPQMTGIECWERYRTPFWEVYHKVIIGRIEEHLDWVPGVACLLAIDVLEHLPMDMAKDILRRANAFVIGVPEQWPQEAVYGNMDETHRSMWTAADLEPFGKVTRYINVNPISNPGVHYLVCEK